MNSTPTTRVESITYSHNMTSERRRFVDGYRQVIHLGDFHCEVDAVQLVAKPPSHMTSLEEAQQGLEPHLRGWELRSELLLNNPIRFRKTGHQVRDEPNGQVVGIGVAEEVAIASEVRAVVTASRVVVPEGPPLDPGEETARIRDRWGDVVANRERLLVGAYWVLTELERFYGVRAEVGKHLAVSSKALNRLGALASRNDPIHGRKAGSPVNPLTPAEISWIRALVPLLILRTAECESGLDNLSPITMADLPVVNT